MLRKTISTLLALACAVTTFAFTSFSASAASVTILHDECTNLATFKANAKYKTNDSHLELQTSGYTAIKLGSNGTTSKSEHSMVYDLTDASGNIGNKIVVEYYAQNYSDLIQALRTTTGDTGLNLVEFMYSYSPHGPWTEITDEVDAYKAYDTSNKLDIHTCTAELPLDARYVKVIMTNVYAIMDNKDSYSNWWPRLSDILITKEDTTAASRLVEYDFNNQETEGINLSHSRIINSEAETSRTDGWINGKNIYMGNADSKNNECSLTFPLKNTDNVTSDFSVWYTMQSPLIVDKNTFLKPDISWSADNTSWTSLTATYTLGDTYTFYQGTAVAVANAKVATIPADANYIQVKFPAMTTYQSTNSISTALDYYHYSVRAANYIETPEVPESRTISYTIGNYGTLKVTGKHYSNTDTYVPGEDVTLTFERGTALTHRLGIFAPTAIGGKYNTEKTHDPTMLTNGWWATNTNTSTLYFNPSYGEIQNFVMAEYTNGGASPYDWYNYSYLSGNTKPINIAISNDKKLAVAIKKDDTEYVDYTRIPVDEGNCADTLVVTGTDLGTISVMNGEKNYAGENVVSGDTVTVPLVELEENLVYTVKSGDRVITTFKTASEALYGSKQTTAVLTNDANIVVKDGNSYAKSSFIVHNISGRNESFVAISAIYNRDGRLVTAKPFNLTAGKDEQQKYHSVELEIPDEVLSNPGAYTLKTFVWNSLDKLVPIF